MSVDPSLEPPVPLSNASPQSLLEVESLEALFPWCALCPESAPQPTKHWIVLPSLLLALCSTHYEDAWAPWFPPPWTKQSLDPNARPLQLSLGLGERLSLHWSTPALGHPVVHDRL